MLTFLIFLFDFHDSGFVGSVIVIAKDVPSMNGG